LNQVTHFFYGTGNDSHNLVRGFFIHRRISSAVTKAKFVSNRMSYKGKKEERKKKK
jgi:hypothetical protein